jgi:predicted transcriptional regulator
MADSGGTAPAQGLAAVRRGGTLAELLFLFDCATEESTRLAPIARRLGVTVQAVSHSYRRLARRGLVEVRGGRYLPTVSGIAWLHRVLGALAEDVFVRQQRLHIIRSCRALASADLEDGDPVSLQLVEGVLTAVPGRSGGSRGRAASPAARGTLVEVRDLEGILRLDPAEVRVITVPARALGDPSAPRRLREAVGRSEPGVVAAHGLEAFYLLRKVWPGPIVRFAVGPVCREAAQVGVRSTVVVVDEELPRLLAQFGGTAPPTLVVRTLEGFPGRRPRPRRGRSRP